MGAREIPGSAPRAWTRLPCRFHRRARWRRLSTRLRATAAFGVCLLLCAAAPAPETAQEKAHPASPATLRIAMHNVALYPYADVAARVLDLSGTVASTQGAQPVVLDDVASYDVQVSYAEMTMDARSLTNLMNHYILPAAHSPIRHVDITFQPGAVQMSGTMVKLGMPVPFSATATLSATPDGELQMHLTSMRAAGVVPKGLMDALGLNLATVAPPENSQIFHLRDDNMILPVVSMFPPPKFIGRLTAVRVTPQAMTSTIGRPVPPERPPVRAAAYLYLHGGTVTFARLTMHDANLTMVPKDGGATLGFSPADYYRQMEAGYTKSLPDFGLAGYVGDYPAVAEGGK